MGAYAREQLTRLFESRTTRSTQRSRPRQLLSTTQSTTLDCQWSLYLQVAKRVRVRMTGVFKDEASAAERGPAEKPSPHECHDASKFNNTPSWQNANPPTHRTNPLANHPPNHQRHATNQFSCTGADATQLQKPKLEEEEDELEGSEDEVPKTTKKRKSAVKAEVLHRRAPTRTTRFPD